MYVWPIRRFGNISNERTIPLIILFVLLLWVLKLIANWKL